MAAAGAGRVRSSWHSKFVDGDDGSSFDILSPDPASTSPIPPSAPVDAGQAISYQAMGTPDGGGSTRAQQTMAAAPSFLVQFLVDATVEQKAAALALVAAQITETVRAADGLIGDLVRIEARGQSADAVIAALNDAPGISFAEVNWHLELQAISNDAYYANGSLWGMYGDETSPANAYGSQAAEVWAQDHTGASTIVVGDVDTGIDYTHRDLYLNVWLNQGELPASMALVDHDEDGLVTFRDLNQSANAALVKDLNANGYIDAGDLLLDSRWADRADGDGNGYTDDLIGWDFVNNDNDPYDNNGHGTHTAGTIGAMGGNGTGVSGVNWNVQIMALKFLDKSGGGSVSNAIKALDYYTAASAADQVNDWTSEFIGTNNSWGGGSYSGALLAAIVRGAKQDALFIAAAGNGGSDGKGDNDDVKANYPSNYSTVSDAGYEAVVSVAALTSTGSLAAYSNYGVQSVDLGAPGSSIWSTVPGGGYASYSGTSMATPHVTGALALYASLHPDFTAEQLRDALLSSTEGTSSLVGRTVTGGRLDIGDLMGTTETLSAAPSGRAVYGTTASDTVVGTNYGDTLSGVPAAGSNTGKGTIDVLYSRAGADLFVLGDGRGAFYEDGNAAAAGTGDYALIADFAGDKIQLAIGNYFLVTTTLNGITGTGIYHAAGASFDGSAELIGIVKDILPYWMSSSDFVWL
jgi:subtilisin family serine protease